MAYDHGMKPPTRSRHYFRLADYSSRIGGFAKHHGSTKLTPRGHPIKATESEGKTFRAGVRFHAARLYRNAGPACRLPGEGLNFRSTCPASCTTEAVRIWTRHPKIAHCELKTVWAYWSKTFTGKSLD